MVSPTIATAGLVCNLTGRGQNSDALTEPPFHIIV